MERLDKLAAKAFLLSRREAGQAIKSGRVTVDGEICRDESRRVDEGAALALDGASGQYEKYVYIMMNKPEGYVSATEDSWGEAVTELLPEGLRRRRLGIVGRLDKDATGLLLITDDGELNHRLTSPKRHMDKVYIARLDGEAGEADVEAFAEGMDLGDFKAMPALLELTDDPTVCRVSVKEGKFHQVKRMFEARGLRVTALRRLSIGPLALDEGLASGEWRFLTAEEKEGLLLK